MLLLPDKLFSMTIDIEVEIVALVFTTLQYIDSMTFPRYPPVETCSGLSVC